jgi:hypothetical protein
MFQFPGFLLSRYCFTITGCPIRTSTDQQLFALPRSFSQLTTSFVISESLGIHPAPLHTFLPSPYTLVQDEYLYWINTFLLVSTTRAVIFYLTLFIQSVNELSGKSSDEYIGSHIETILFSSFPIVAISRSRTGNHALPYRRASYASLFSNKKKQSFLFLYLVTSYQH